MTLGHICEVLTNKTLDVLIRERVTEPLGMSSTRFNPPEEWKSKIAPTEYQYGLPDGVGELEPRRPQPVWGSVSLFIFVTHVFLWSLPELNSYLWPSASVGA